LKAYAEEDRTGAHFEKPAFFCGIQIPLLRKKERKKERTFFPAVTVVLMYTTKCKLVPQ